MSGECDLILIRRRQDNARALLFVQRRHERELEVVESFEVSAFMSGSCCSCLSGQQGASAESSTRRYGAARHGCASFVEVSVEDQVIDGRLMTSNVSRLQASRNTQREYMHQDACCALPPCALCPNGLEAPCSSTRSRSLAAIPTTLEQLDKGVAAGWK